MALLRADMLTNIQYIILIILINMINQQALNSSFVLKITFHPSLPESLRPIPLVYVWLQDNAFLTSASPTILKESSSKITFRLKQVPFIFPYLNFLAGVKNHHQH